MDGSLKVGDEVVLYAMNRPKRTAKVERIGRTLVHVTDFGRTEAYRIDTQKLNGHSGTGYFFRTLAQETDVQRRSAAVTALHAAGVRLDRPGAFNTEQIEAIVDLVRSFS